MKTYMCDNILKYGDGDMISVQIPAGQHLT